MVLCGSGIPLSSSMAIGGSTRRRKYALRSEDNIYIYLFPQCILFTSAAESKINYIIMEFIKGEILAAA